MEPLTILLLVLALIVIGVLVFNTLRQRLVIFEYQRGLYYVNGKLQDTLEPGVHWVNRRAAHIERVDIRERVLPVQGQEVLSSDGISIRITLAATYKISDPVAAITEVENYYVSMYNVLQLSLRKFVGSVTIDDLLQQRDQVGSSVEETAKDELERLGIELLSAEIRDITFPGSLKALFAEEVRARKEGLATLERARGETAALRNLANAAKMMKDQPALMQLRLMQVMSESTDNTFIVNLTSDDPGLLKQPKKNKKARKS
ncbi:MAG: slipin family protein [Chloroflexi bacterium]|nr:MAG: slipin family protein [Chloroflexota bacterium]MBL1194256.1 slipin family protein [Chloroflexota bacterium]NOH11549.1 slipin family protein [Chloroflexota bacterium]